MPSQAHAVLVDIFRSAPGLTVDLLQALASRSSARRALASSITVLSVTSPRRG